MLYCRDLGVDPVDYLTHLFLNVGSVRHGDREGWRNLLPGRRDISDAVSLGERLYKVEPCTGRKGPYRLKGKKLWDTLLIITLADHALSLQVEERRFILVN